MNIKPGDKVKVKKGVYKHQGVVGKIGIYRDINNIGEIWVDFPDGRGSLVKKVIVYKKPAKKKKIKTNQSIEFYYTIVEHHVHKDEWCPVKSCQEYVELTGKLPFVIINWNEELNIK